jgi:quercetin dioxygenase-like cupin family protein
MEFIAGSDIKVFSNSGVESQQLLFPENHSSSSRVTITRVIIAAGALSPRHRHETSEQIWVALSGTGTLLLDGGQTRPIQAGDVVRFADGDIHGIENTSALPFVYLAVTSPPINFRQAYAQTWTKSKSGAP